MTAKQRSTSKAANGFLPQIAEHLNKVFWQHKRHWLIVAAIIAGSAYLGHYLQHHDRWLGARYQVFRWMQNPWPRRLIHRDTVTVLIDDDAFRRDADGRRPLKRDYLAALVRKVADLNPAVVGIDVRMPSPDSEGIVRTPVEGGKIVLESKAYAQETSEFLETIADVATSCDIVLVETLERAAADAVNTGKQTGAAGNGEIHGHRERPLYQRVPDVHDEFGLDENNVAFSYEFLYPDRRRIPPTLLVTDGSEIDSFALAAARFYRPNLVDSRDWTRARFGSFIGRSPESEISAHDLMHANSTELPQIAQKLKHKIVLIGGNWHDSPSRTGSKVDSHVTPVGELPGVVLHANYVEAILDDRAFDIPARERLLIVVDVLLGLLFAYVLFVSFPSRWLKLLAVVAVIALPPLACLLLMQYFAMYWDVFIMDVLLVGHIVIERLIQGKGGH